MNSQSESKIVSLTLHLLQVAVLSAQRRQVCCRKFLPFDVLFCDGAPAFSADGEALVSVVDVDFDVRVSAFSVPGILAVFG
jgi:hypothetical protein